MGDTPDRQGAGLLVTLEAVEPLRVLSEPLRAPPSREVSAAPRQEFPSSSDTSASDGNAWATRLSHTGPMLSASATSSTPARRPAS